MNFPGGWEIIANIAIIIIIFGGGKVVNSMKNAGKEIYRLKKDVDDIKKDIYD